MRWKPDPALSVDGAMRWEVSRLKVNEPTSRRLRTFSFGKPRLDITYVPQKQTSVCLRIAREVRQLEFQDFVASASLDTLEINAGNPAITPETNWYFELWGKRRFGAKGSVSVAVGYDLISDALDCLTLQLRASRQAAISAERLLGYPGPPASLHLNALPVWLPLLSCDSSRCAPAPARFHPIDGRRWCASFLRSAVRPFRQDAAALRPVRDIHGDCSTWSPFEVRETSTPFAEIWLTRRPRCGRTPLK